MAKREACMDAAFAVPHTTTPTAQSQINPKPEPPKKTPVASRDQLHASADKQTSV